MTRKIFISGLLAILCCCVQAQQTKRYNLAELLANNELLSTAHAQTTALPGDKPGAISTVNTVWFKNIRFAEGTIDIDLRGKDQFLASFLGIVFHGADTANFDVLYFRPFNFKHKDTARRHWSVQYATHPNYGWPVLRKLHPLVYESTVDPVPDPNDWFHATIIVKDGFLRVYVNHAAQPSLEVHLLNNRKDGMFGFFSDGLRSDFANLVITPSLPKQAMVKQYNLADALQKGQLENSGANQATPANGTGKDAVHATRVVSLKNISFENGSIEADIRGRDLFQQCFVGIAFHVQDTAHYEVVYLRPFNFNTTDSLRKQHAVQYMSMPDYRWDKLRTEHPDAYEAAVMPAPEATDWFHIKITVNKKWITVYINNSPEPSLQVQSLGNYTSGKIALWADADLGNNEFANLVISN